MTISKNARVAKSSQTRRKGSGESFNAFTVAGHVATNTNSTLDETVQPEVCSVGTDTPGQFQLTTASVYPTQNDSLSLQPLLSMLNKDDLSFHDHEEVDFNHMAIPTPDFSEFELHSGTDPWTASDMLYPVAENTIPSPPLEKTPIKLSSHVNEEWDESLSDLVFPLQPATQVCASPSSPAKDVTPFTSPQDAIRASCNCLQKLADLLNNVTETAMGKDYLFFDASLAYLRQSVEQCSHLVHCSSCISRPEFCLVLILTMEKIIFVTGKEVMRWIAEFHASRNTQSPDSLREESACSFGSYNLSAWENLLVSRTLIALHLNVCCKLLARLRSVPSISEKASQRSSLLPLEARIKELINLLRRIPLDRTE
jgi:hypothetical protein